MQPKRPAQRPSAPTSVPTLELPRPVRDLHLRKPLVDGRWFGGLENGKYVDYKD